MTIWHITAAIVLAEAFFWLCKGFAYMLFPPVFEEESDEGD